MENKPPIGWMTPMNIEAFKFPCRFFQCHTKRKQTRYIAKVEKQF